MPEGCIYQQGELQVFCTRHGSCAQLWACPRHLGQGVLQQAGQLYAPAVEGRWLICWQHQSGVMMLLPADKRPACQADTYHHHHQQEQQQPHFGSLGAGEVA
jgi:hypothetical protein